MVLLGKYFEKFSFFKKMRSPNNPDSFSNEDYLQTMRYLQFMPVEHEVDVITQGDDGDRFYVVLKGTLNVRKAYLAKVPRF